MASFDPTNMKLNEMRKGYFVDYDLKTWQVDAWYEYDWGNDFFTDEYKLTAIGEREPIFLHVENTDQGLECVISNQINLHEIQENVAQHIISNETPQLRLNYKGKTFFRESESAGYFRNTDTDNWEELVSWTYHDADKKEILSIEQWGPEDFEAHIGVVVNEFNFSNILPSGEEIEKKKKNGGKFVAPTADNRNSNSNNMWKYVLYGIAAIVAIWLLIWLFSPRKSNNLQSKNSTRPLSQQTAPERGSFANSPVDKLIEQNRNAKSFSIILEDMQENGNNYQHKYKVITNIADPNLRRETITPWVDVTPEFYARNHDNQFMELASKTEDGKINKDAPAPPGYSSYIGNEKYGQWQQNPSTGQSFWAFYGQYAFMSSMFNLATAPVYRNSYYDYRDNYYGRQPYYGARTTSGAYQYGSTGAVAQQRLPTTVFEKRKAASQSFKDKVQSSVQQSSPRTPTNPNTRPSGSTPTSSSSSTRKSVDRSSPSSSYSSSPSSGRSSSGYSSSTSRSSSRYSSGSSSSSSSSRSRGGRSGK